MKHGLNIDNTRRLLADAENKTQQYGWLIPADLRPRRSAVSAQQAADRRQGY